MKASKRLIASSAALCAILLLAGCQTPQQAAEAHRDQLEAICSEYGIREGDPRLPDCMMRTDQVLERRREAAASILLANRPLIYAPRPPITTNCYQVGTMTRCTTTP